MVYTSFQQSVNVKVNLEKNLHIDAWVSLGHTYIYAHIFSLGEKKNILWDTPSSVCKEFSYATY